MIKCYLKKLSSEVNFNYNKVAIAVRHGEHVAVIYERDGKIITQWYPEFLSQPFFTDLSLRRLKIKTDDQDFKELFRKRILLLYHQVNASSPSSQASPSDEDPNSAQPLSPSPLSLPLETSFFSTMKMLTPEYASTLSETNPLDVSLLDSSDPSILSEVFKLSNKIIVRNSKNKNLKREAI